MSFSSSTKNELCRLFAPEMDCTLSEIGAVIDLSGIISAGTEKTNVKIHTENATLARKIYSMIKSLGSINPEIIVKKSRKFKKHNIYTLSLSDSDEAERALSLTEPMRCSGRKREKAEEKLLESEDCCKAYLRGAFLAGGSISDPEKTYHLEITTHKAYLSHSIWRLMNHFDLNAKIVGRKSSHVVYIKEGEHIIDFLNIIGAHHALMGLENIRILKEMRNNVNRIVNCETANLEKIVNASVRQVENIEYLINHIGLEHLPENLREIAELRIKYSEASLKELGEMLSPPVGKSGVNHRLRKLDLIAEKMKNPKGEL